MGLGDAVSDISETAKPMIRLELNICIDVRVLYFSANKYVLVIAFRCVYIFRNTTIVGRVVATQSRSGSRHVRKN